MRILVSGSSGPIGAALLRSLRADGIAVTRLVRAAAAGNDQIVWDPSRPLSPDVVSGFDAVIHLAGETIVGRWTEAKKRRIRDSRIQGTGHLAEAAGKAPHRPRVFISASAVGFYGDRGDEELHESSPPGKGFLPEVCVEWEREAERFASADTRVVRLRIGIVLDKKGGALPRMVTPFRLGLGGPIGDGKQWMPWVHVDDVVGLALHAFTHGVSGAINAVAPHPVRQAKFAKVLAAALGRPALLRTPKVALRVAFGEMADVILASQRVLPIRANASG